MKKICALIFCLLSTHALAEQQSYHLGVALGISGTGLLYCMDGLDAIQLAVDEINANGGFLGKHPIRLFVKDTKTNQDTAMEAVRVLITEDHVRCILGTYSSGCAIRIKPLCRENKVLHIAAISNSENITKKDFSPYTFSVAPNSYMQARAVVLGVTRMARQKNWKQYVTIASDYDWGRSTQTNFKEMLKKEAADIKLLKEFWPSLGSTRFTDYITEIMKLEPDFIYGVLGSKDNFIWMMQARKTKLFQKIAYPGSLISVSELISQAQTIDRGLIGLCRAPFFAHLDNDKMKAFVKAFRKRYNRYPSDWAVMEYDAVYALQQGISKAGSIDSSKVKTALQGAEINTCRGRLFFRKIDNQLSCSSYLGVVSDHSDYNFPIYKDLIEVKGPDSWRPENEIMATRK